MGGKGGGGDDGGSANLQMILKNQQAERAASDKAAADKAVADKAAADQAAAQKAADKAAADQAAADKAASDKAASDAAAADKAAADKLAHTPLGNPIAAGGAIATPGAANNAPGTTLGGDLGGAVLSPPNYWVGSGNKGANTGRTSGSIKTVV